MMVARSAFQRNTAVNRRAKPQKRRRLSPMVAFLVSDAAADVSGQTFGVGGNRLFAYRVMTSRGVEKRGSTEPWTQREIIDRLDRIMNY